MSDISPVLPNGFGYPYVWIFNNKSEIIQIKDERGELRNINEFIEGFKYRYDEENDDECTIKIGLVRVEQLNEPIFKEDVILKVQWGYILPNGTILKSARRVVAIRYVNPDYKSNGLQLELVCTDLVSYLKNIKANKTSDTDNLEEYIKEIIAGDFIATRTIKGKTKIINRITGAFEQGKFAASTPSDQFKTTQQYQQEIYQENKLDPNRTQTAGTLGFNEHVVIKENDLVIKGKSKVISQVIEEKLNEEPEGPHYLEGRDNVINILKRDFTQPIFKQYTYAGSSGELIEFRANSNEVTSRDDEGEINYVNPVTKKIETTRTGHAVEHEGEYSESGLPEGVTELDVKMWYQAFITGAKRNLEGKDLLNQSELNFATFKKTKIADRGHYNNANNMGNTRVSKGPETFQKVVTVPTRVLLSSPYINRLRRERLLENYIMKKIEKKYEGRAKTMGDPSLISSKIYDFRNLSNIDKGKWYCTAVEHDITPNQAYICSLDLIRKPKMIARIMERKDYEFNKENESSPEYDERKIDYNTEPIADAQVFGGLNATDIGTRLEQQTLTEGWFQGDNDIRFQSKRSITDTPRITNSQDA